MPLRAKTAIVAMNAKTRNSRVKKIFSMYQVGQVTLRATLELLTPELNIAVVSTICDKASS